MGHCADRVTARLRSGPPPEFTAGCLDWLADNLSWFSPATWDAHFPPREIPSQTVLELLLLCRVMERGQYARPRRRLLEGAREIAVSELSKPSFLAGLSRVDEQFPYLVWLLGLVGDFGPGTAIARARVQQILDLYGASVGGIDWPPTPAVELSYLLSVGGFAADVPGFEQLLGPHAYATADPLRLLEPDGYAITHVLLYASDLGARELPLDPVARDRLHDLLLTLLGIQLADAQLDLSSELLHCIRVVAPVDRSRAEEPLVTLGWQRLATAQLPSGAVPGPPYSAEIAAQRSADELDGYLFRACYHTTIVAAMAALAGEGSS